MTDQDEEIRSLAYKNKRIYGALLRLSKYYLGEEFKLPLNQVDAALTIAENIIQLYPKDK